ncbi:hypothetical protein D9758_003522 [Tetrapyrgos nigripes]|uniref:Uncharacterized protein n=1 Tax=Tetrapyrgos nigripes TaxID=182062 RepID=A0A8H5GV18_9AGAR|nr:hypothetical protein D9758_003522 [Tetrapyrgos nigripes]
MKKFFMTLITICQSIGSGSICRLHYTLDRASNHNSNIGTKHYRSTGNTPTSTRTTHPISFLPPTVAMLVSYAAPLTPNVNAGNLKLVNIEVPGLDVRASVPKAAARDFEPTNIETYCDCKTIPDIIFDLTIQITPLVNQLKVLKASECTVSNIKLITGEMKIIISNAIVEVKALADITVDAALSTTTGVLSLIDLCKIIATLYSLIFGCFGVVLNIVLSVEYYDVCGLFAEVAVLLASLLQLICGIVGGLTIILQPLLVVWVDIIVKLGCRSVFSFVLNVGISL